MNHKCYNYTDLTDYIERMQNSLYLSFCLLSVELYAPVLCLSVGPDASHTCPCWPHSSGPGGPETFCQSPAQTQQPKHFFIFHERNGIVKTSLSKQIFWISALIYRAFHMQRYMSGWSICNGICLVGAYATVNVWLKHMQWYIRICLVSVQDM